MSDLLQRIVSILGVLFVALGLIGILVKTFRTSSDYADSANETVANMATSIAEDQYTKYDGAIVSGSEVVSAIKYFDGISDVCVTVTTSRGTNNFIYTGPDLQTKSDLAVGNTRDKRSTCYINPSSKFLGKVVRDADGTINNIVFEVQ